LFATSTVTLASRVFVSPRFLPVASAANCASQHTFVVTTKPSLPNNAPRVSSHCALPSASISATASNMRPESCSVAVPFQYPAIAADEGGGVGGGLGGGLPGGGTVGGGGGC
jgi:hypothetical protein